MEDWRRSLPATRARTPWPLSLRYNVIKPFRAACIQDGGTLQLRATVIAMPVAFSEADPTGRSGELVSPPQERWIEVCGERAAPFWILHGGFDQGLEGVVGGGRLTR